VHRFVAPTFTPAATCIQHNLSNISSLIDPRGFSSAIADPGRHLRPSGVPAHRWGGYDPAAEAPSADVPTAANSTSAADPSDGSGWSSAALPAEVGIVSS